MSSKTSGTVSVTYNAVATNLSKVFVEGGEIRRYSDDSLLQLTHRHSTTKAGRIRSSVALKSTDLSTDPDSSATVTVTIDRPSDNTTIAKYVGKALVAFLNATTLEEVDLLVQQQNFG